MADTQQAARPLSPHLQIYRRTLTMMLSIIHRLTGIGLYMGTVLLAAWLIALAMGPEAYDSFMGLAGSLIGRLIMFGYTWALIHHMFGGIRHFIWDTGRGFGLGLVEVMAWIHVIASITLTVLVWVAGYMMLGAM